METDWQTLVALLMVAMAAIFVLRRLFFSGGSTCGGACQGCSDDRRTAKPGSPKLIQLNQPNEHD